MRINRFTVAAVAGLERDRLTFIDLATMIADWLRTNR